MNLNKDNIKVIKGLYKKRNDKGRMPSIKVIARMLDDLGVKSYSSSSHCTKPRKSAGVRYYTSGGNVSYNGTSLSFKYNAKRSFYGCYGDNNTYSFDVDTTDTYYTYNTCHYSYDLLNIVADVLAGNDDDIHNSLDDYFSGYGDFDANCKKVLGSSFVA